MSDLGSGHQVSRDRYIIADIPGPKTDARPKTDSPTRTDARGGRERDRRQEVGAQESRAQWAEETGAEGEPGSSMDPTWSRMFAVSHGIQGLPAADRASEIVAKTAEEFLADRCRRRVHWRPESYSCTLNSVPLACAEALSDDVERFPWERGLASTLTLAHVVWPMLYLVHVGDCRCYLRRHGQTMRLTADQVFDGTLADQVAPTEPPKQTVRRRTVWSFIEGPAATNLRPQVTETHLELGDTLILCSSGLTQGLNDQQLGELLSDDPPAKDACQSLLAAAHDRGVDDDMTVIVVRFRAADASGEHTGEP